MKASDASWRKFEQLVTRIEELLAPKGAIIKSPDYIPDKVTGENREVDASIRYQIGSVPILITIECRERRHVQDDTWIEQLAQKREKIGAAKTIAVSSSGFTQPAIKSAQFYGIELRRIDDVTDDEIAQQWMENLFVIAVFIKRSIVSLHVFFDTETQIEGLNLSSTILEEYQDNPFETAIAFQKTTNAPLTINSLFSHAPINEELITGNPPIRKKFTTIFDKATYYSITNNGIFDVKQIDLIMDLAQEEERISFTEAFQYSDLQRPIIQIAKASISLGQDRTLWIEASKNPESNTSNVETDQDSTGNLG